MYGDLTKRQNDVLKFIIDKFSRQGYPPTIREICLGLGIKSTSTVYGHLHRLEKKGYIRRDPSKPRAIEVLSTENVDFKINKEVVHVPLIGKVTAGTPILATENIEDSFPIPLDILDANSEYFLLRVQGTSMIDAGILDKDYALIKKQSIASNGDIVVALIEDEATIKRFFLEKNHVRLQPENSLMEPILLTDAIILGLVKGIFRKL